MPTIEIAYLRLLATRHSDSKSEPSRQLIPDLQRLHTRSPDHSLSNGSRQFRHLRVLATYTRSVLGLEFATALSLVGTIPENAGA